MRAWVNSYSNVKQMTLGKTTFEMNKSEYSDKIRRIIANHRVGSRLIGEPAEFVLRSCRLTEQWAKLSGDPAVLVYLRNVELAGGRKVKMLSLERGATKQPIAKAKLIEALYPTKKTVATATAEEKHFNTIKSAMRNAVAMQLKRFRDSVKYPCVCCITGKSIRLGQKTDVDHIGMPFSEIADRFVASKGLKYSDITLVGPPSGKSFSDKQLWEEWTVFHLQHAKFAMVCASANRSKGSSGYETDAELYGSFKAKSSEELSLDF
jgi:hypothetical protein